MPYPPDEPERPRPNEWYNDEDVASDEAAAEWFYGDPHEQE